MGIYHDITFFLHIQIDMAHGLQLLEAAAIPNFDCQVLAGLVHLGDLSNAEKDEGALGWWTSSGRENIGQCLVKPWVKPIQFGQIRGIRETLLAG